MRLSSLNLLFKYGLTRGLRLIFNPHLEENSGKHTHRLLKRKKIGANSRTEQVHSSIDRLLLWE